MTAKKVPTEVVMINGVEYIPKSTAPAAKAVSLKGMPYVIARTYSAGVFAGYQKSRKGQEVELLNARRLWYWKGAASLSQLAMEGVLCPTECKFPCEVDSVELLQVIEILPCTETARLSIKSVTPWSA